MKPYEHAEASAKVFGGEYKDYIEIHKWFDQFRFAVKDPNHRMFLHHTGGVLICEQVFGDYIANSDGKNVAVRDIAEHHIVVDVGEMRTPQEWLDNIGAPDWTKPIKSKIEKQVEKAEAMDAAKNFKLHNTDEKDDVEDISESLLDQLDQDVEKELLDDIDDLLDVVEDDNSISDREKELIDIIESAENIDDLNDEDVLEALSPLEKSLKEKVEQLESKVGSLSAAHQTFD